MHIYYNNFISLYIYIYIYIYISKCFDYGLTYIKSDKWSEYIYIYIYIYMCWSFSLKNLLLMTTNQGLFNNSLLK